MSATPDLDALTARAQSFEAIFIDRGDVYSAALIRALLTYATTVRQERDKWKYRHEADVAEYRLALKLRENMQRAAEHQVASLTAQLAEARAKQEKP